MRLPAAILALFAFASSGFAEPFHHSSGEWREYFRDWLASCPDRINEDATDFYGYSCFASTGSEAKNSANLPAYKLTLIRNRLDGTLDVAITVAADSITYDEARPMRLLFSGTTPVILNMGEELETRFNTTNQYFVVDPEFATQLIDQMKERNAVSSLCR